LPRASSLAWRRPGWRQAVSAAALNIPFEKYTLPNGLTIVLAEDHATPTVSLLMMYPRGVEERGKWDERVSPTSSSM
jgi:predicted Zn-dependent peptidase